MSALARARAAQHSASMQAVLPPSQLQADMLAVKPNGIGNCTRVQRLGFLHTQRQGLTHAIERELNTITANAARTSLGILSKKAYVANHNIARALWPPSRSSAHTIFRSMVRFIAHFGLQRMSTRVTLLHHRVTTACLALKTCRFAIACIPLVTAGWPTGGASKPAAWQAALK